MRELLYFTAKWCGPCKHMGPIVQNLIDTEFTTSYKITKVDIELDTDSTSKFNIKSVPTFVVMDADVEIARITGSRSPVDFATWLEQNK